MDTPEIAEERMMDEMMDFTQKRTPSAMIMAADVTSGPVRDWPEHAAPTLAEAGVGEGWRDWDTAILPYVTAGFCKVNQNIPRILEQASSA